MNIIIAGGTGFLGRALQAHLSAAGHTVRVLTRNSGTEVDAVARSQGRGVGGRVGGRSAPDSPNAIEWRPDGTAGAWASALEGTDAVVNLSGAGIADARWTTARKAALRDSRILSTRSLVVAMQRLARPPAVFVSSSAVGYYGDQRTDIVTEATLAGRDFLAQLCIDWEREAEEASRLTRVAILRNGLVLDASGGALGKMLVPFRLGLGGPLGSGAQYLPWIHRDDWLALTTTIMATTDARGPFNVTAPKPATNADFTRALGRALGRPAIIPVPGFALRVAFGELADTLLTGQRAVPARAEQMGFTFRFREIEPALRDLLR